MNDYTEIKNLFDRIRKASNEPLWVEALEGKYFSPNNSDWEFYSPVNAIRDIFRLYGTLKDPEKSGADLENLSDSLYKVIFDRGYREDILSHQEHRLTGSSGSGSTTNESPYTVGGILSGKLTLEEARRARDLVQYTEGYGNYWGVKGWVTILLPQIDEAGNTIHDPAVVDRNDKNRVIADTLVPDAPYKRT